MRSRSFVVSLTSRDMNAAAVDDALRSAGVNTQYRNIAGSVLGKAHRMGVAISDAAAVRGAIDTLGQRAVGVTLRSLVSAGLLDADLAAPEWSFLGLRPAGRPKKRLPDEGRIAEYGAWLATRWGAERARREEQFVRFAVARASEAGAVDAVGRGVGSAYSARLQKALAGYLDYLRTLNAPAAVADVVITPLVPATKQLLGVLATRYRVKATRWGRLVVPDRTTLLRRLTWRDVEYVPGALGTITRVRLAATTLLCDYDAGRLVNAVEIGGHAIELLERHAEWASPWSPHDPLFPCAPGSRLPLSAAAIEEHVGAWIDEEAKVLRRRTATAAAAMSAVSAVAGVASAGAVDAEGAVDTAAVATTAPIDDFDVDALNRDLLAHAPAVPLVGRDPGEALRAALDGLAGAVDLASLAAGGYVPQQDPETP